MSRRKPRSGVLLLVVLSLLVLFTLATLTFLVVAKRYKAAAANQPNYERVGDNPRQELDSAMYQVLRDTTNHSSSLLGHSLLADLYGNDGLEGTVTELKTVLGGQATWIAYRSRNVQFQPSSGHFGGAVITMLDGPAVGLSTRVIYDFPGRVMTGHFESQRGNIVVPEAGNRFRINGRPFNGTGAGYNPNSGELDADPEGSAALLPYYSKYSPSTIPFDTGGVDESWDAVDFQNLFLASPKHGIPSFHRPALLRYWKTNHPELWSRLEFRRLAILRPMPDDHPEFTGSNPAMEPDVWPQNIIDGPWDVDNDGDGVPDSIWVDIGLPVSISPTGQLYKRLFAILCIDLDGRINVNAHGSLNQILGNSFGPIQGPFAGAEPVNTHALPRGSGYGPSEVQLGPLFLQEMSRIVHGVGNLQGRYGLDRQPGTTSALSLLHLRQPWTVPGGGPQQSLDYDPIGTATIALDPTGYPFRV